MKKIYLLLAVVSIALSSCKSSKHADLGDGIFADITTTEGEILLKLEYQKTPLTVANFISLAEGNNPFVTDSLKGKKYYDGIIFHRIIKDFMIQGGDPTGTGMGNPGYKFKDEFNDSLTHNKAGILSMANSGPTTNGSQFFITHKETPFLNGRHTVFGEVVKGMDIVDSIANVKTAEGDRPVTDVVMNTVEIIRNGKEAKKFDAVKVMSDYFAEEEERIKAMEKMKTDFLTQIGTEEASAEELPSGLKILRLAEGDGEKPKVGQKVDVLYAVYLPDGSLLESNFEEIAKKFGVYQEARKQGGGYKAQPMDYSPEAKMIPGFKEGLMQMKVGDKIRLFVPSHLGYGEAGYGPIPPNANLVFDLVITGIAQ
jgi:cyclophilin family peptidyl-prolyl cis-trans isomerase